MSIEASSTATVAAMPGALGAERAGVGAGAEVRLVAERAVAQRGQLEVAQHPDGPLARAELDIRGRAVHDHVAIGDGLGVERDALPGLDVASPLDRGATRLRFAGRRSGHQRSSSRRLAATRRWNRSVVITTVPGSNGS